jgi:hypothetical protein
MGIKADKTFEEIVERLVSIFRPQPLPEKERTESDRSTPRNETPPAAPPASHDSGA